MKPADLILVHGDGLIAEAIEGITHSAYSHMAGVVRTNELIEAQGGRKVGYQALHYYIGADVYTCDQLTDEQRARIVVYVERYIGKRYSYLLIGWELIRYGLHLSLPASKHWHPIICSVIWARAYRSVGIDPFPGKRFPSPADVPDSSLFRKSGKVTRPHTGLFLCAN